MIGWIQDAVVPVDKCRYNVVNVLILIQNAYYNINMPPLFLLL